MSSRRQPTTADVASLARGVRVGERATIARAITLIESRRSDHQKKARRLVQDLLPATGKAVRVGITGAPGVGKSTTIDALGTFLTAEGHKVAVLAVDPSSARSGGRTFCSSRPAGHTSSILSRQRRGRLSCSDTLTGSCGTPEVVTGSIT